MKKIMLNLPLRLPPVRSFLARRGLHSPAEPEGSGMPWPFAPNLPVFRSCDILPLPSEAPLLSKLLEDLFREALGFSDASKLCFQYCEIKKTGVSP